MKFRLGQDAIEWVRRADDCIGGTDNSILTLAAHIGDEFEKVAPKGSRAPVESAAPPTYKIQ